MAELYLTYIGQVCSIQLMQQEGLIADCADRTWILRSDGWRCAGDLMDELQRQFGRPTFPRALRG